MNYVYPIFGLLVNKKIQKNSKTFDLVRLKENFTAMPKPATYSILPMCLVEVTRVAWQVTLDCVHCWCDDGLCHVSQWQALAHLLAGHPCLSAALLVLPPNPEPPTQAHGSTLPSLTMTANMIHSRRMAGMEGTSKRPLQRSGVAANSLAKQATDKKQRALSYLSGAYFEPLILQHLAQLFLNAYVFGNFKRSLSTI